MNKMPFEEIARQAGALRIIKYLYQAKEQEGNDKITVSSLGKKAKVNQAPLYKSLVLLDSYGIVEKEEHKDWFPPRKYYSLTDFGTEIAKGIIALDLKLQDIDKKSNIL